MFLVYTSLVSSSSCRLRECNLVVGQPAVSACLSRACACRMNLVTKTSSTAPLPPYIQPVRAALFFSVWVGKCVSRPGANVQYKDIKARVFCAFLVSCLAVVVRIIVRERLELCKVSTPAPRKASFYAEMGGKEKPRSPSRRHAEIQYRKMKPR